MPKIVLGKSFRFSLNKSTMKLQLKLSRWIHLYCLLVLAPNIRTMGLLSRCKGDEFNRHCLFGDYDDCMLSVVRADARFAQRMYDAGPIVVLQSGESDRNVAGAEYGNFHTICPQKFSFAECNEIVAQTHTDFNFREVAVKFNYRAHVLRIYPKVSADGEVIRDRPIFRELLYAPTGRETCTAMYDFLKKWYGMPDYPANHDGRSQLSIIDYNTTGGWRMAITDRFKKLAAKIRMQMDVF